MAEESKVASVSIRAWLAVSLVLTVCVMSFLKIEVTSPLQDMALLAIGFYYGQKST